MFGFRCSVFGVQFWVLYFIPIKPVSEIYLRSGFDFEVNLKTSLEEVEGEFMLHPSPFTLRPSHRWGKAFVGFQQAVFEADDAASAFADFRLVGDHDDGFALLVQFVQ